MAVSADLVGAGHARDEVVHMPIASMANRSPARSHMGYLYRFSFSPKNQRDTFLIGAGHA
ncbi:hypothetical protein GCM10009304_28240 [Pseudomonas matsuisoli]|uniref:Uncharacterized protein n=1 Tax=Pseudomonas matsuisoli TaxID=1515666 RepID=A0A917PYI6_9PSED|nr:hypothetical protein GCM10009304_28240 [Pseudomonas matsuisoli]